MFNIAFCIMNAMAVAKAQHEYESRFEETCKSLPPEMEQELRRDRQKRQEDNMQHQRNLEVAREGRSLNFWGNR